MQCDISVPSGSNLSCQLCTRNFSENWARVRGRVVSGGSEVEVKLGKGAIARDISTDGGSLHESLLGERNFGSCGGTMNLWLASIAVIFYRIIIVAPT